jgi:phage terminase large subunit-like protein
MDLSTKLDITALAIALPRGEGCFDFYWEFWVPAELVRERTRAAKSPDYAAWVRNGYLRETPGNVIDFAFVRKRMNELAKLLKVRQCGFDPWNATQLATELVADGWSVEADAAKMQLVEMRQGARTLSEPSKLFETSIIERKLRHGSNPVMRWMVDNAAIRRDANDNIAPDKRSALGKIDGVVASIMAIGRAMLEPAAPTSVYEKRGLRAF